MSSLYSVTQSCLRYVIPFKFGETFEEAYQKVENQKEPVLKKDKKTGEKKATGEERNLWVKRKETAGGPECDLYGYIRNEFRFDESGSLPKYKTGCEWLYWKSNEAEETKNGEKIKKLRYFPNGISSKDNDLTDWWDISILNVGLMLFRNGLGFVWYEIEIQKKGIDSNQLKKFQNTIRELKRDEKVHLWEESREESEDGIVFKETNGYTKYFQTFSMAMWIREMLSFVNPVFFAERVSTCDSMIKKEMVPDKPILFSYVLFERMSYEDSLEDRLTLTYHLTNGYKDSYHASEETLNEIKRPFEDAVWYATQEGAAYLAWPDNDNREVFNSNISSKIRTDYFTLYIKTLYQSFSLLLYAEKIQREISAVYSNNFSESSEAPLTGLVEEINLFLTKSMATSVSFVHHQSAFYIYLKMQLRIHEDVKSVTSGLNALDSLKREQREREENKRIAEGLKKEKERERIARQESDEREEREKKRDSKVQAIMGLFAMLGISSALLDCFDFIGKFETGGEWNQFSWQIQCVEIVFMVVVGIISIIAVIFAVKAIVDAFRNKE